MPIDMFASAPAGDADVARTAALIGARARVLMALADGRALPASVLAAEAGVAASTISEHLAQLVAAELLTAQRQGRARYFRLADPSVAEALEAIARIRQQGPVPLPAQACRRPCGIAAVMHRAEQVWRAELAATTVADLLAHAGTGSTDRARRWLAT